MAMTTGRSATRLPRRPTNRRRYGSTKQTFLPDGVNGLEPETRSLLAYMTASCKRKKVRPNRASWRLNRQAVRPVSGTSIQSTLLCLMEALRGHGRSPDPFKGYTVTSSGAGNFSNLSLPPSPSPRSKATMSALPARYASPARKGHAMTAGSTARGAGSPTP